MRNKFISILKRWPPVHRFAKILYWKVQSFKETLFGTKIQERYWQKRHLEKRSNWDDNKDWAISYWDSKFHPHRQFLIEKISRHFPLSILEIGSNCGPKLYLLAKKIPQAKLYGIDINEKAVKMGKGFFDEEGIKNIELLIGKADELGRFLDKSFDIVFTDAVLIYIGPDKIKKVIKEMIRITKKVLIFIEWHENSGKDPQGMGIYHFRHWKRNYINLFKQFVKKEQIHITKIPEDLWPGKDWSELGYVIEVML
jgi:ubiquinone/menaquinone biosynthesis C-methylase UbiE